MRLRAIPALVHALQLNGGVARMLKMARVPEPSMTEQVSRVDLRTPVLAGALVSGGLAVALALYKIATPGTPTTNALGASAAAAVAPTFAPAKLEVATPTVSPVVSPTVSPVVSPVSAPAPQAAPTVSPVVTVSAPAPQAAPTVSPIVDQRPALVELSLTSKPAGATIMVVDRGVTSLAGSTPLALSVDPSRAYDIVFTVAGQPAKTEHVDPTQRQQIAVDLAPAPPPAVAMKAKPTKRAGKHHRKIKPTS